MKWLKRIGLGIGVLLMIAGGAAAFLARPPAMRPVDPKRKFEATAERLERGRYIVNAEANCMLCHAEHDWKTDGAPEVPGMLGAGWDIPFAENKMPGRVFAPNITSDPETGIGAVPDDAIARALREGVGRDGRALFPMMPWMQFRHFSDEELASVIVYLRTLPPVKKQREVTELIVPVRWFVRRGTQPLTAPVPEADQSDPIKRGAHLVELGSCKECHTPVNERHEPLPGMDFAGGQEFRGPWGLARSANITPHASGLAHYDEALFVRTIRTGNIGGRRLSPIMPWGRLRNLTDDDLKAIWAYLKTVTPVAHDVTREPVEVKANPLIDEHPALAVTPAAPDAKTPAASPAHDSVEKTK